MKFREMLLNEKITKNNLDVLEKYLDDIFNEAGLDIEFTRHFLDRANDSRNGKEISIEEIKQLFIKTYNRYKDVINKHQVNWEAVLTDINSKINIPFVLNWNKKKGEMEMFSKTIMRKENFLTRTKRLTV